MKTCTTNVKKIQWATAILLHYRDIEAIIRVECSGMQPELRLRRLLILRTSMLIDDEVKGMCPDSKGELRITHFKREVILPNKRSYM
jgi:hypothetical protein